MITAEVKKKPKVVVIVGPTASGKSALAVKLARKFNGEIISADSRQVYRGLDIGSGKVTKKETQGVPHHLLSIADPRRTFTAARYKKLAEKSVRSITRKQKIPIICGGTGFYIDIILGRVSLPEVPPNKRMRDSLSKKNTSELFEMLSKLDWRRAQRIDKHNPIRLIRAIEIATQLGAVPDVTPTEIYRSIKIGILISPDTLKKNIVRRLSKRFKLGLVKEVARLQQSGLTWKRLESFGLEYRYVSQYHQKELSEEEMIQKLHTEIWRYAKRQMTWFKRDKEIRWISAESEASKLVASFLKMV